LAFASRIKKHEMTIIFNKNGVLFRNFSELSTRRNFHQSVHRIELEAEDETEDDTRSVLENEKQTGFLRFFFGFMFEDPLLLEHEAGELDDEILRRSYDQGETPPSNWNRLNASLFVSYALTTIATSVPVTLIPSMSENLRFDSDYQDATAFAPRITAYAVLGTACGKFILSSMGDIFGARRTACCCSIFLAISLLVLSMCKTANAACNTCFCIEFFQSVQWPCIIVLLATHYRQHGNAVYENGIYITSLASRFGVLLGIPLSSMILRKTSWRIVALLGAWAGLLASSVIYLFIEDSPLYTNDPQNPIDPQVLAQYERRQPTLSNAVSLALSVFRNNVAPSLKHVLQSPTFYIVAVAHTGSSIVRTSERIVGTYYLNTSLDTLSENQAGGLAVFLSLGTIFGLVVAGSIYTNGTERQRKRLVTKLYISTIVSCYVLAILAIPWLRNKSNAPSLILIFQVMATFVMGFSIAVQLYAIPSLVGATFGADKGLYAGYTDGFAYAVSSLVWRVVGNSVQNDKSSGMGWFYGWAAVALILIISAVFMVEFMEHYFVRTRITGRGYETIIFA